MRISSINLKCFMRHDATEIALPERGIVVITGPNGGGKSSIAEGVATAVFGKTLRGSSPWREGTAGSIEVLAHGIPNASILRKHSAGDRVSLFWGTQGGHSTHYETTTKAQEALSRIVGSFDVWRRSHVFSASDASHFSGATDGERKRLLESVLGIERFDTALEACRTDLKRVTGLHSAFTSTAAVLQAQVAARRRNWTDLELALHALVAPESLLEGNAAAIDTAYKLGGEKAIAAAVDEPSEAVVSARAKLSGAARRCAETITSVRFKLRELGHTSGEIDAERRQLAKQLQALEGDSCSACGQAIPEALRAPLRVLLDRATLGAQEERKSLLEARSGLEAELVELEGEHAELTGRIQASHMAAQRYEDAKHEAERYAHQRAHLAQAIERAAKEHAQLQEKLVEATESASAAAQELKVLEACERVLGLQGVRANVLGRALGGIEQCANAWLARLRRPDLRVRLKPYTEKKSGGVNDAISLVVEGAGGGHGYKAASAGERRRIDIALLLALGEIASAATNRANGTIFADEIGDSPLDPEGQDALAEALQGVAQQRCVVVISHSERFIEALRPQLRLHVEAGKVV